MLFRASGSSMGLPTILALLISKGIAAPLSSLYKNADQVLFGPNVAYVPKLWNNVFPAKNFNRNVSTPFWQVEFLDEGVDENTKTKETLNRFSDISFIAYDTSFYQLLGIDDYNDRKEIDIIFTFAPPPDFAERQVHDGTVYSSEANAIFFAELHVPKEGFSADAPEFVWKIDLNQDPPKTEQVFPFPQLCVANGASYYNGAVYWAQEGNYTTPGGIVRMDPTTLQTNVVNNNFYAHRYNSPNDVVITSAGVAFFTDGYYGFDNFNDSLKPELANGVYRWDLDTGSINQAATATDGTFLNPNGVALNYDENKLYVTSRGNTSSDPDGARTIHVFDITEVGLLRNHEIFAYSDASFADGIKVDREGRVYCAVLGAVDVYNSDGMLIGRIKIANGDTAVNMIFVEKHLFITGRDNVYRVSLNISPM